MRALYDVISIFAVFLLVGWERSPLGWILFPKSKSDAPDRDPFYVAPFNLSSYHEGQPIRSRPTTHGWMLRNVGAVHQVLYRTNDTQHNRSATVVTIFTPKNVNTSEPAHVISLQLWQDSASFNCAPSYTLASGFNAPNVFTGLLDAPVIISRALKRGWYVVAPDHQGPRSAFMAGYEEGRATLDGVRAGINFLGLAPESDVALVGYSGGGHATAWAAHLHERYAPDLHVVAAAYGGTPLDLNTMIAHLNLKAFSGLIAAGISGILASSPKKEAELWPLFDPNVKESVELMRSRDFCVLKVASQYSRLNWIEFLKFANDTSVFEYGPVQQLVRQETLLGNSSPGITVPKFPRYLYHAGSDEMVTHEPIMRYIEEQCEHGADIVEFAYFPGMEHLMAMMLGAPRAVHFIEQVFDGTIQPLNQTRLANPLPGSAGPKSNEARRPCGPVKMYSEPSAWFSKLSLTTTTSLANNDEL